MICNGLCLFSILAQISSRDCRQQALKRAWRLKPHPFEKGDIMAFTSYYPFMIFLTSAREILTPLFPTFIYWTFPILFSRSSWLLEMFNIPQTSVFFIRELLFATSVNISLASFSFITPAFLHISTCDTSNVFAFSFIITSMCFYNKENINKKLFSDGVQGKNQTVQDAHGWLQTDYSWIWQNIKIAVGALKEYIQCFTKLNIYLFR